MTLVEHNIPGEIDNGNNNGIKITAATYGNISTKHSTKISVLIISLFLQYCNIVDEKPSLEEGK